MFDSVVMVDWSGGNDRGATPKKDAIWACVARQGRSEDPVYLRNRQLAEAWIIDTLEAEKAAQRRVLIGFDLCFAYPKGFARHVTGSDDPLGLWDWFAARVADAPTGNNRFDLAGEINARFPGTGPFWANALRRDIAGLPRNKSGYGGHGLADTRSADRAIPGAFSPWQLAGAGAVGGQVIMGLPVLSRLRHHFGAALAVWPFQPASAQIVMAETYFSMLSAPLDAHLIKDAAQVMQYAQRFSKLRARDWELILDRPADPEGWVLGAGHIAMLEKTPTDMLEPPALTNDCFAMPQGAHWTPVDEALAHLRAHLGPVTASEDIPINMAAGRILAADVTALRSHPPHANAAVDGYALAGPMLAGRHEMPLTQGRAAAGVPFTGTVPPGHALRILTGAHIPDGTDTVILQEDIASDGDRIAFHGPLKQGANARKAGEDMTAGDVILRAGRRLDPGAIGTAIAAGVGTVAVRKQLRVGVLSTGDELAEPGAMPRDGQIFDANRPMLLATVGAWGYEPIDLGRAPDDRTTLRDMLSAAAQRCDVILTSGGASAGEEDHISALLKDTGSFALWRIAMKPGRPLALGLWDGVPVFGLPGNPVAAYVCALIFAAPSLATLAGGVWKAPAGFTVPAGFSKSKKDGRREYLRARIIDGRAEVFPSEGSGRVSGLAWATGLICLGDAAQTIAPGDPVTFLPFNGFGS